MIDPVLFDLDGTLTDPYEGITHSVQYALQKLGRPVPAQKDLLPFIGPPLGLSFQSFCGMDEREADEAVRLYRVYFADRGIFENALIDGIPELLDALKAAGRTLYVATSKPTPFALRILEHFDILDYFAAVFGSDLEKHTMPKADIVAEVLRQHAVDPAHTVMVGDRKEDIVAAHENGVRGVGVLFGYGSREELENAGADLIAATVKELQDTLLERN